MIRSTQAFFSLYLDFNLIFSVHALFGYLRQLSHIHPLQCPGELEELIAGYFDGAVGRAAGRENRVESAKGFVAVHLHIIAVDGKSTDAADGMTCEFHLSSEVEFEKNTDNR